MGVPTSLLPHTVTRVRPTSTENPYGDATLDYGAGATRTTMQGWMQQQKADEALEEGRDPNDSRWLLIVNESDVLTTDRIEWTSPAGLLQLEVEGDPKPVYTPAGFHHLELTLRHVRG